MSKHFTIGQLLKWVNKHGFSLSIENDGDDGILATFEDNDNLLKPGIVEVKVEYGNDDFEKIICDVASELYIQKESLS